MKPLAPQAPPARRRTALAVAALTLGVVGCGVDGSADVAAPIDVAGPGGGAGATLTGAGAPLRGGAAPHVRIATPPAGGPASAPGLSTPDTVDPLPGGVRILPLGDSITWGLGAPGGYRLPLWSRLQSEGVANDFVGTQVEGSPPFFVDPEHEGHIGWRVEDLIQFDGQGLEPDSTIESILAATEPDQILLHIGTNDLLTFDEWHLAPNRLRLLLERIWAFDPTVQVVLATIVPTAEPATNLGVAWYRREVTRLAAEAAAAGRRVRLVDMAGELTVEELALIDPVHPGAAGYRAMADLWLAAVTEPGGPIQAPEPLPPAPPFQQAVASSVDGGYLPSLAVNGVGLDGGLHDDEPLGVPLGWRSAPFQQEVDADGIGRPVGQGPVFVVRLPGLGDVQALQVWNGRNLTEDGEVWLNLESIRSVKVETQGVGGGWTDRGVLQLTRGMARSRAPYELIEVDWPATRAIRLRVLTTYGPLEPEPGPTVLPVALSEVKVLGPPAAGGGS